MNTARLNQGTPLLLNAVSKHYAENIVLNQLDLHIPAGQFVAGGGGPQRWWQKYLAAPAGRSGNANRWRCVSGFHTAGSDSGRHANDVSGCASAAVEIGD